MAKTATKLHQDLQKIVDYEGRNQAMLGSDSFALVRSERWLAAIHLRLCEAAEQRERTNELLEELITQTRGM